LRKTTQIQRMILKLVSDSIVWDGCRSEEETPIRWLLSRAPGQYRLRLLGRLLICRQRCLGTMAEEVNTRDFSTGDPLVIGPLYA
jgi:hypothetical protein